MRIFPARLVPILFGKQFPERFFNVGVMEPTMITIASGLALSGRTAFAEYPSRFLPRVIHTT